MAHLIGESDKYYDAYHKNSVDWTGATTELLFEPSDGASYLITRLGFTAYNVVADFAQDIKLEFYDREEWETRLLASNYAGLSVVADRVDNFTVGASLQLIFLWHYRNGIMIHGSLGEKMKVYPSDAITGCSSFYFGLRYLKFVP